MDMQHLPLAEFAGMIYLAVMLFFALLSLLIPFFIWRIWKWSYVSSQELVKLNSKIDELLANSATPLQAVASEAPVEEPFGTEETTPEEAEEPIETPAEFAVPAVAMESAFEETPEEEDEQDFNFEEELPEETAFEENAEEDFFPEEPEEKPAGEFSFEEEPEKEAEAFENSPSEDSFDDLALSGDTFTSSSAFSMDEELPEEEEQQEEFPAEENPFTQEEQKEDTFEESESAAAAAAFEPEPAEPEEEKPAIFRLPDNPKTPDLNLARCGSCDHKLSYRKALAGKKAKCPSCKTVFTLP